MKCVYESICSLTVIFTLFYFNYVRTLSKILPTKMNYQCNADGKPGISSLGSGVCLLTIQHLHLRS